MQFSKAIQWCPPVPVALQPPTSPTQIQARMETTAAPDSPSPPPPTPSAKQHKYSQETRQCVVDCTREGGDWLGLAHALNPSPRCRADVASSVPKRIDDTSRKRGGGSEKTITLEHVEFMCPMVDDNNQITLQKLAPLVVDTFNISCSRSAASIALDGACVQPYAESYRERVLRRQGDDSSLVRQGEKESVRNTPPGMTKVAHRNAYFERASNMYIGAAASAGNCAHFNLHALRFYSNVFGLNDMPVGK